MATSQDVSGNIGDKRVQLQFSSAMAPPAPLTITSVTLAVDTASITFSTIPTGNILRYSALVRGTKSAASDGIGFRLNGDGSADYDNAGIFAINNVSSASSAYSGATSYIGLEANVPAASATAGVFAAFTAVIPGYSATVAQKVGYSTSGYNDGVAGVIGVNQLMPFNWRNSAAVTSVQFFTLGGNMKAGTAIYQEVL